MKTFLDFTTELRKEIWPASEAVTLRDVHTTLFRAAMIDLQKWIDCLHALNGTIHSFCSTYWENAKTVIDLPNGYIYRIYTIANDDWRDMVLYWSAPVHEVECWGNSLWASATPATENIQQGFRPADAVTDGKYGRARIGIWTIHNRKIYVAPFIQSNEKLVVEWKGPNFVWADSDLVNDNWWTRDVQEAVKYYVLTEHEDRFGDPSRARTFKSKYDAKLSDLMWHCREVTRQKHEESCDQDYRGIFQSSEQLIDDVVPTATTEFISAFVADYGSIGTPLDDIAAQINSLNVNNLIAGGDCAYDISVQGDADVVGIRNKFVSPKKVWFVPGNHDWDHDADLSDFLTAYDTHGNGRYYDFVDGPAHYFILSGDPREPDAGFTNTSTLLNGAMMDWLSAMLAISTARWKVVVCHFPPYSSDVLYTPGALYLRADFKAMGADLMIAGHGHNFEHIVVNGFPYIVCGLGGGAIRAFGASTTGVQKQYNANYAYLKLKVNCSSYRAILTDRTGTEVYTVELTK